jgi:hypothetical protein
MYGSGHISSRFSCSAALRNFWLDFRWTYIQVFWNTWLFSSVPTSILFPVNLWQYDVRCISHKPRFHQEPPGDSDCPDSPDGTSDPRTENQTRPVAPATGQVAYFPLCSYYTIPLILSTFCVVYYGHQPVIRIPLLWAWIVVMYTHHQNVKYVTLFAELLSHCSRLPNFPECCVCLSLAKSHIVPLRYCYLSDAALSHVCFTLRSCPLLQYSLRFAYMACDCIWFSIIVFFWSEIECPIFTLSSTIHSVVQSQR